MTEKSERRSLAGLKTEDRAMSQGVQVPLEAGKGTEAEPPQEPWEGTKGHSSAHCL